MTWQGRTFIHDANGNVTSDGSKTYQWDARNLLSQVGDGAGALATFLYEPTGRRLRKSVGGTATDYLYSGRNFIQEQSGGVTTSLLTGFSMDEVYGRSTPSGSRSYLVDALGSTLALADETGTPVAEYTYGPYGASTHTGDAAGNTQTFTGREDDGTGLRYHRARYYDPMLGRFLQPEPLRKDPRFLVVMAMRGEGLPTYGYALNSPTMYGDPDGRVPALIAGALIGGAAIYFGYEVWALRDSALEGRDQAENALPPDTDRGRLDALRHCTASCLANYRAGYLQAMVAGWYNELPLSGNNPDQRRQDLDNNACGRLKAFSVALFSEPTCIDACLGALNGGELEVRFP